MDGCRRIWPRCSPIAASTSLARNHAMDWGPEPRTCFCSLSNFIMTFDPRVTGGADEVERNYGVPLDPAYPRTRYGVDGKRSLVAKAVISKDGVRTSFLLALIDTRLRPEILRAGDPRFDDMVLYRDLASEGFSHRFRR